MKVVLVYRYFSPYHLARIKELADHSSDMEFIGLNLYRISTEHSWTSSDDNSVVNCNLVPDMMGDLCPVDIFRVWTAIRSLKPDVLVVNGWGTKDALACSGWAWFHRIPRVIVSDSQEIDFPRRGWREHMKRLLVGGCAAFVAGTPQRQYVMSLGVPNELVFVGCNAIDNEYFNQAPKHRYWKYNRVLTVARLSPEKNLELAARAFLRFVSSAANGERWVWTIVGDGPLRAKMESIALDSGGSIQLLGWQDYEKLPEIYAGADLYWQPSLRDTWALPVAEAMASGMPVLVSNRCGCGIDLVTPSVGWLIEPTIEGLLGGLEKAAIERAHWPKMGDAALEVISKWGLSLFRQSLTKAATAIHSRGGTQPCVSST